MINKIDNTTSSWNRSQLFRAGKVILVNIAPLSISSYYPLVYSTPDAMLDAISKLARNFRWVKDGNYCGIGILYVNWNKAMLDKFERGLGN